MMKAYAVVQRTSYTDNKSTVFFSSRIKALLYIAQIMMENHDEPRGYPKDKNYYDAIWCYDAKELFKEQNWNKFFYVAKTGTFYIKQIEIR